MGLTFKYITDEKGCPAGGVSFGPGFSIAWQNGPTVAEDGTPLGQNGAFVEDIILSLIDRFEYYQSTKFACEANANAIVHLNGALSEVRERIKSRKERGVFGTHES